jgi:hypothetical protein
MRKQKRRGHEMNSKNNDSGYPLNLWTDPEREEVKSYSPREEKAPDIKDKVKIKPALL